MRRCGPKHLYHRDQHYVVQNGEVIIVDEFTGRLMTGRAGPTACTRPSRPRKACRSRREPDARLDHLPELLPHVRQARRHDRHGRHRSLRVPGDLRPGDRGDPAQPPTIRKRRLDLVYKTSARSTRRWSRTSATATSAASRCWWAPPRSRTPNCLGAADRRRSSPHQVLNAKQHEREARSSPRPGARRDHHRHQHGRPRHRHRAGRQRREPDRSSSRPTGLDHRPTSPRNRRKKLQDELAGAATSR